MYEDNRGYAQVGSYDHEAQEQRNHQAKQERIYTAAQEKCLGIGRSEAPCRVEAVVSVELKQLEEAIGMANQAAQDFVSRVTPVLYFGPENACTSGEPDCPPGSDVAQKLYRLRQQLMSTVYFLRTCEQKVNL